MLGLLVIAAKPIPTPSSMVSQQAQTESKTPAANQKANYDDQGTKKAPLLVKLAPAQQLQNPSQDDSDAGKSTTGPDWFLVVVGMLQLCVFTWQGLQLKSTVEVTKIAADAAEKSTESLTTIERAHVYPVVESHGALQECIKSANVFYVDSPTGDPDKPSSATCEISFKLVNFGKTPAILKEVFVGFGFYPVGALIGVGIERSILGPHDETEDLICSLHRGFTRNEVQHIFSYTGHVTFEGKITFFDIWNNEYITEFEFAFEPSAEQMQLCGFSTKRKGKA